ncbi:hypothetical protein PAI11_19780 [Patulibacter medicamentivorans]|uniref:Uncharacterized protein n=1 Tax=Patulibacter medicamentivorans TaxID=1097667 RepID=H0E588_9ACTN|nr:hypothetical protein PAI11_19780 [Patulibacter medicamentivorans]
MIRRCRIGQVSWLTSPVDRAFPGPGPQWLHRVRAVDLSLTVAGPRRSCTGLPFTTIRYCVLPATVARRSPDAAPSRLARCALETCRPRRATPRIGGSRLRSAPSRRGELR